MCGTTISTPRPTSWTSSSAACGKKSTGHSRRSFCTRSGAWAMSSVDSGSFAPTRAFGLRIALWYATLFIVGALAIVFLTYYLTSASLAQRDRQLINAKLGQYAAAYARGGLDELADTV